MEKRLGLNAAETDTNDPSEQVLLDVIQRNVQRLPLNDNALFSRESLGERTAVSKMVSAVSYGTILLVGALLMVVFKLVPASKDSQD